jgi:cob(I)alamin adenosyltransferase
MFHCALETTSRMDEARILLQEEEPLRQDIKASDRDFFNKLSSLFFMSCLMSNRIKESIIYNVCSYRLCLTVSPTLNQ